ncbi:pantetheine-phosphate adenylyltransferase [Candidatus Woesebacteria bacterium]|nr:pantetheine-phosphate adenylyltransferase [Candidatus Woesebacteria bacterium]
MQYTKIALGGTFDHFHLGHQSFIAEAAQHGSMLVIGVTSQSLSAHKVYASEIESFEIRSNAVRDYCRENSIKCEVVELYDIFGPTIKDENINALFITKDTLSGAEAINSERESIGLNTLHIIEGSLLQDDTGEVISSARIRAGEINRSGKRYSEYFSKTRQISNDQRIFFSKPQGEIILQPTRTHCCAVVGDSTLETFLSHGWDYTIALADLKKQRTPITSTFFTKKFFDQTVSNPAGEITSELATAIIESVQTGGKIFVEGEEDLAAVAAVLLLPLGSRVYYGQPHVGIVEIVVSEEKKEELAAILDT